MKTTLDRLRTLVKDKSVAGGTLSYVQGVEVVHPELELTTITITSLPKILLVPVSTLEEWIASQEKQATHVVVAYMVIRYMQRESSIMGDITRSGGQGKGIMDFAEDFISVVRGHRLATGGTPYLHKPLDIQNVDYMLQENDSGHLLIAAVTMQAVRTFLQTSLPGDV